MGIEEDEEDEEGEGGGGGFWGGGIASSVPLGEHRLRFLYK